MKVHAARAREAARKARETARKGALAGEDCQANLPTVPRKIRPKVSCILLKEILRGGSATRS